MLVGYRSCSVRWRSHDVKGISARDFECAVLVEALIGDSTQSGPHLG
jgi:4a-hydroxytetrahydrobiopterin dehydratase